MSFPPLPSVYSSDLLFELALARDVENGCSLVDVSKMYPGERWREEIDPCSRRRWYLALRKRRELDRMEAAYEESRCDSFLRDVDAHKTGISRSYSWDAPRRLEFYVEAMTTVFGPFGFKVSSRKLGDLPAIFTKAVNENWRIALVPDGSLHRKDVNPHFELSIFLYTNRPTEFRPRVGHVLRIKLDLIVPGFYNGYLVVNSLDELEVAIRARSVLFSICEPHFERALAKVVDLGGD